MRKNKFFDTIMICLVLMIAVKVMFPNAFGGSSSPSTDNPDAPSVDTSYMVKLPVYADLAEAENAIFSPAKNLSNYFYGFSEPDMASTIINNGISIYGCFYSTVSEISVGVSIDDPSVSPDASMISVGIPTFYIGDTLYYCHSNCIPADFAVFMSFDIDPNETYLIPYYQGA